MLLTRKKLEMRSEVSAKLKVTQMAYTTPPSQDESTHQFWDSDLKSYRSYAPHIIILETRS